MGRRVRHVLLDRPEGTARRDRDDAVAREREPAVAPLLARAGLPGAALIELVDHRASWKEDFQQLAGMLRDALGASALRIDHIGSTSVPGLCAKDIIDIQVTVASLDEARRALRAAGFVERAEIQGDHVPPGYTGLASDWSKAFFNERAGSRPANIHVRLAGKPNQRYALLFRDYLRSHPETAQAYGELKRRLAASLANVDDYADVKDPAVDLIYLAAQAWARHTRAP